ncbi:hypothetical protein SS50377_28589 [Spironucleus salmonicida]|uniref:Uncharacterized protein n=1 Tax=Spironucleus salmonicida TaxID=348837 RepID=A0A9P8LKB1_9EUKA|nr:hypothetical protein SS50377_28589 [Spironucleus salmonicida]
MELSFWIGEDSVINCDSLSLPSLNTVDIFDRTIITDLYHLQCRIIELDSYCELLSEDIEETNAKLVSIYFQI